MGTTESAREVAGRPPAGPAAPPSGLLDLLSVAAVVLNADGQVVFWSPKAEELFGYTATEALGRFAADLTVHEEHRDEVIKLFAEVMESGSDWAGAFPIRHKNGSTRLVEFRNMRAARRPRRHLRTGPRRGPGRRAAGRAGRRAGRAAGVPVPGRAGHPRPGPAVPRREPGP
ncbi:hypothetical protein GCM10017687_63870 [Streptomyces echinatus]